MIARVVKYHSIAEWDFSLWFALQGRLAGAAAFSLHLREFAKNSRIFAAFAPGANRAPQFFSLVNQRFGTLLAFDMRMPPP